VGVEHTDRNPLRRPCARYASAPCFIEVRYAEWSVGRWKGTWIRPSDAWRRLRGPETKAKCPEIGLLVVRVKSVEVSVSVDGRSSGLAVFERGEGAAEGGHPGLLEAGCRLLERDGLAPLEQRND
jgi:hypothetical protein